MADTFFSLRPLGPTTTENFPSGESIDEGGDDSAELVDVAPLGAALHRSALSVATPVRVIASGAAVPKIVPAIVQFMRWTQNIKRGSVTVIGSDQQLDPARDLARKVQLRSREADDDSMTKVLRLSDALDCVEEHFNENWGRSMIGALGSVIKAAHTGGDFDNMAQILGAEIAKCMREKCLGQTRKRRSYRVDFGPFPIGRPKGVKNGEGGRERPSRMRGGKGSKS